MTEQIPEYMCVGQLMIGLESQGFCSPPFDTSFPIRPALTVVQLKSEHCPSDKSFDVLGIQTLDFKIPSTKVGKKPMPYTFVEKYVCGTMAMFTRVIHQSKEENDMAGICYNFRAVLNNPTSWGIFEFRASDNNNSIVFDVKDNARSNVFLHNTTFNPAKVRLVDFMRYRDMINALPTTDEDAKIEFACRCFADGMFDHRYYTFYFVEGECFASEKELRARWSGVWEVQGVDEEIKITTSFVDCCTHIPTVSIKRCYLDGFILKFLASPLNVMAQTVQKRTEAERLEQCIVKMRETDLGEKHYTRSEMVKRYNKQQSTSSELL